MILKEFLGEIAVVDINEEIIKAEVVGRYKRLIVDVKLRDDSIVPVFCSDDCIFPNLYEKGAEIWISKIRNKLRKLRYEVQAVNKGDGWVMVNQRIVPKLFVEAFKNRKMDDFRQYTKIRHMTLADKLPHLDFELSNNQEKCLVSLRPIYNKQDGKAVFPSKVNFFDMEMFEEMKQMRAKGWRTVVVLIVPRMDCLETKFSWIIDPISAARIYEEAKNGLEFVCYGCKLDKKSITITDKMNISVK